jgi:hypothetical protein
MDISDNELVEEEGGHDNEEKALEDGNTDESVQVPHQKAQDIVRKINPRGSE